MNDGRARRPRIDEATRQELAALNYEVHHRRIQIFRSHLARTIRLASPLLIDACSEQELDEAVWRVKPGAAWPRGPCPQILVRDWSAKSGRRDQNRVKAVDHVSGETFLVMDRIELQLGRHTANMVFTIGSLSIHTSHRGGWLILPRALDEAERSSLLGAPLDRIVALPMTMDRPYSIVEAPAPLNGKITMVRFEAAPVQWLVPWARPWDVPF